MNTPVWYTALWAASALAYALVAVMVLKTRSIRKWGGLFCIGADEALFFLASQFMREHYRAYFYTYWWNSLLVGVLQTWLVSDVFRSMPASKFLPDSIRFWTPYLAAMIAMITAYATAPDKPTGHLRFYLLLNRMGQFSLGAGAVMLILGLLLSGFALTPAGFRIAAGALLRQSVAMALSLVVAVADKPHGHTWVRVTNSLDTFTSLCVALFWAYAIAVDRDEERKMRKDWEEHGEQALRELQP